MRRTGKEGFSLTELLVVLAVAAVMLLLSLVAVAELLPRWRVDSAARNIASALEAARARAILERTQVSLPFDTTRRVYVLTAENRLPGRVDFCSPDGSDVVDFAPPSDPTETVAVFDSAGLLRSNNLPSSVYVCDAFKNEYRRIRVSPVGTVSVSRWTGSAWE